MRDEGDAMVVWEQESGGVVRPWARRFSPAGGWLATATPIDGDNQLGAADPSVTVDTNGHALAFWSQSTSSGRTDLWWNRFTVGSGWGAAALLEINNGGSAARARSATDANGRAVVVWEQGDGLTVNVWANRFE
jgi:hypothetical protein